MSALGKPAPVSVEEYLAGELLAEIKHEYLGGELHAMAGATNRHNKLASNVLVALGIGLRGKTCRAFNSDTKIRIELRNHTRFYYPDAMVVCRENPEEDQWQDRPVVIVEVLSESTRRIDLMEKREAYCALPSLKALIFVEPGRPACAVHRRCADGDFAREDYSGLDTIIPLPEIGAQIVLAEVYEGVGFEPAGHAEPGT